MLIKATKNLTLVLVAALIMIGSAQADKATINQKDTDIGVFIEMVSRITGKTFIVDPRVKNKKITVISQHPMDEDEVFALFLSVLKVHQFSAVETDGIYKIEQLQTAKQDSVDVYSAGEKYSGDQLVTRIIKVDNVDVGLLVPLLRSLIPQQGHMAQYKPTNVIVIHDSAANLERIVKIIRKIDKESNEELEVIELEHASATEVVRILENIEKQNSGAKKSDANKPKFVADERTNSILLSANKKASLRLRALIAKLDAPMKNAGNTMVRHLRYAKAEDLATLLEGVADSLQTDDSKKKAASSRRGGSNKLYSIKAHAETNSLVITAPPDIMKSFDSVINQLDIRRQQVHVEAIIVEVSETLNKELGVQWISDRGIINYSNTSPSVVSLAAGALANRGLRQGSAVTVTNPNGTVTTTDPISSGDNGVAIGQAISGLTGALLGFSDGESWATLIKVLATDTESNVLSTPSLTTLDNEEATISIGQEIPILTGTQQSSGGNQNPFNSVGRQDVGIKLKITPQINEGNAVVLEIEQEVSGVAGSTAVDIITNKRQINTTVLVNSGQTIVLGGLIDNDVQESTQRIPILGDIPWLGRLFSSTSTAKRKTNLMVFIRPTIITDSNEINSVSSKKYNYMRALQEDRKMRGIALMPLTNPEMLPEWDNSLALPPSFEENEKQNSVEDLSRTSETNDGR